MDPLFEVTTPVLSKKKYPENLLLGIWALSHSPSLPRDHTQQWRGAFLGMSVRGDAIFSFLTGSVNV